MHIEKDKVRYEIDGRWRCHTKDFRKTKSIFDNTMFKNSHIPIKSTLRIVYMYCMGIRTIFLVEETDVSRQAMYNIIDQLLLKLAVAITITYLIN
jgi:transposase-like protein